MPAEPLLVYLGRHIPEKQVPAIIPALAIARCHLPDLRAAIFGSGPDSDAVQRAIAAAKLQSVVDLPGFVTEDALHATLRRALCLILLSRREGYGLVVAEAAAHGVPCVVLRHPDSAASELIVDGVNGVLCESADSATVASAILRIHDAGYGLRQRTLAWSRDHATELAIAGALPRLLALYCGGATQKRSVRRSCPPP
jgi:glycosyltransferase involved in cell wall biosynthesis